MHKSGSKIITADDGTSKIAIYVEAISSILYTLKYVDSGSYYLAHEDNQMQLFTSFPEKFTGYYFSSANIYKGGTYNIQFYWNANNPYYKYVDPNVGGTNAVIKEGDTGTGFTVCDQAGNCSF